MERTVLNEKHRRFRGELKGGPFRSQKMVD